MPSNLIILMFTALIVSFLNVILSYSLIQHILKLGFMERSLVRIINFKSALVMDFFPVAYHQGSSIPRKKVTVIKNTKFFRVSTISLTQALQGLMQILAEIQTPNAFDYSACAKTRQNNLQRISVAKCIVSYQYVQREKAVLKLVNYIYSVKSSGQFHDNYMHINL